MKSKEAANTVPKIKHQETKVKIPRKIMRSTKSSISKTGKGNGCSKIATMFLLEVNINSVRNKQSNRPKIRKFKFS